MQWAVCVKDKTDGKVERIDSPFDSPASVEKEFHVLPCFVTDGNYSFGYHEFNSGCVCHPKVVRQDERTIIIHTDKAN